MPFNSRKPEISTMESRSGRSPRAGKTSVPPARICPPREASAERASSSVRGRVYKKHPLPVEEICDLKAILIQGRVFVQALSGRRTRFSRRAGDKGQG